MRSQKLFLNKYLGEDTKSKRICIYNFNYNILNKILYIAKLNY